MRNKLVLLSLSIAFLIPLSYYHFVILPHKNNNSFPTINRTHIPFKNNNKSIHKKNTTNKKWKMKERKGYRRKLRCAVRRLPALKWRFYSSEGGVSVRGRGETRTCQVDVHCGSEVLVVLLCDGSIVASGLW